MTLPQDAALRLARFIWPEDKPAWSKADKYGEATLYGENGYFDFDDWDLIHAAEAVLIERGLGEEYGRALYAVMLSSVHGPVSLTDMKKYREDIAVFATAPKEDRVRAMLRVGEEAK